MKGRTGGRWHTHRSQEHIDTKNAKVTLQKVIALMHERGEHEAAARLLLPDAAGFLGNDEMEYFADRRCQFGSSTYADDDTRARSRIILQGWLLHFGWRCGHFLFTRMWIPRILLHTLLEEIEPGEEHLTVARLLSAVLVLVTLQLAFEDQIPCNPVKLQESLLRTSSRRGVILRFKQFSDEARLYARSKIPFVI